MIRVELVDGGWATWGTTHSRGYAHLNGRSWQADGLARLLDACASEYEWQDTVSRLNGCFAAVTQRNRKLLAAVDRIRSIPLFYSSRDGECLVSDSAFRVSQGLSSRESDPITDMEFRLTGYVTGEETLCAGVYQIKPGELLIFDPTDSDKPNRRRYFHFQHRDFFSVQNTHLVSTLEEVHLRVFQRLVQSVDARPMVLPLSGGYDSRLVGVSLRDMGIRDVVCYSYGVPGNWESRISQELASYLGFRWEFVPYSPDRWRNWTASEQFQGYFRSAGNLTSVPHIQDWPAVFELQRDKRIPADSVFVPGHSGDFLAGSHIPKWYRKRHVIRRQEIIDSVYKAHYSLWDWPAGKNRELQEHFEARIEAITGTIEDCHPEQAADLFERWDLQERQAKFICNSMRVYEYFGYEWRLPLFDHELMDFWTKVPVEARTGRKLYLEFVRQRQTLPVSQANKDHSTLVNWILKCVEASGLWPVLKRTQSVMRRILWRREYSRSPMAWYSIFDPKWFKSTYTGKELFYSYLAMRYRDLMHSEHVSEREAVASVRQERKLTASP